MMHMARFVLVLALVACGGGDGGGGGVSQVDASPADAVSSTLCTGAVYDPCTSNDQCASGACHLYTANALQVCTQACSATMPCPNDAAGKPVTCNQMGNCKPSVANDCHR